ncbi:hypothetical protein BC937DRAFT_93309 [Endogone sp. FLAS-F59071]|nr:hypothetical protein BC937DRAFT_93309 [Endogone sp. FLAS-F59071]|eukprot:RUS23365.1 hypothetical protein BC937DRAFT_93309 [Endogone sp. FLAS-F59071]
MTIGAPDRAATEEPNPDFVCLNECRKRVEEILTLQSLELSMGMSDDFEEALKLGSTNIRVGSTIFGARPSKH